MESGQEKALEFFDLGKLYCERCDFNMAIEKFNRAADLFFEDKNFDEYLKCQNYLLRIHGEKEEFEKVNEIKEFLQDLVLREGFELTAKTYYTLALCASYKGQTDVSMEYCRKSLSIALAKDEKEDICYAINAIAINYYKEDRLTDALKEIYNLKVFFEVLNLPSLRLSNQILNGHIFRKLGRFDEALDVFWNCYDVLKESKDQMFNISLLYGMGLTYEDSGQRELACMYMQLAGRMVDPDNTVRLARLIDEKLKDLGVQKQNEYDLTFDPSQNSVTEKKRGRVDFKNQFILLDLLHLFMKNPGKVFSKEELVQKIWKQDYNPSVHDNKIYVTIKRLRKMIEPDYDQPKYVFRAKNGYYLNKSAKVLVETSK